MNQATLEKVGCEEHLYRGMRCCLHPEINTLNCPEPICAADFPGGVNEYIRWRQMSEILRNGADINEAAIKMGIDKRSAQRLFNKFNRVAVIIRCR